jgi:hypothetical protein
MLVYFPFGSIVFELLTAWDSATRSLQSCFLFCKSLDADELSVGRRVSPLVVQVAGRATLGHYAPGCAKKQEKTERKDERNEGSE